MGIAGIEGMSLKKLNKELKKGGKFVYYQYTISILVLTFKRGSKIHFIPAEGSGFVRSLPYTCLSMVTGWWGIPWGPIYTIESIINNCNGGVDVTSEVASDLRQMIAAEMGE